MVSPYRGGPGKRAPDVAPEPGLIDEMVRQFADPHAFLRELVQNGIDAGAKRLLVTIDRDGDGTVRTAVEDDGTGMSRAIIEGPLLTLFQSSKESDSTKIGKYGVGFLSVFATKPERVEVRTRTASEAWIVTLFPDHSFELARDDARSSGTGTVVTLVHSMDGDAFTNHAQRAAISLSRWCRHAHVPILLDGTQVNEALDVDALVTVRLEENDARYIVGVGATETWIGYYNRGLTLFETHDPEPELVGVRVKIDAPTLAHTLSRDNVRRDAELRRVIRRAVALVRGPLWSELEKRIAAAAEDVATAADPTRIHLLASLYEAAAAPAFARSDYTSLAVPLLEPRDGRRVLPLGAVLKASRSAIATTHDSSALTRALAEEGTLVVRSASMLPGLQRIANRPFHDALTSWILATTADVHAHPEDAPLLGQVAQLLIKTGRDVARVVLARFEGGTAVRRHRVAKTKSGHAVLSHVVEVEPPWSRASTLFLDEEDAAVRLARRRAKSDPRVAAHLLVRSILLAEGPIAKRDVDLLLEAAHG